jgi:phosphohistidine phosphatase
MKTLLLMRHAKSSWDNPSLSDHDRPLNKRGKRVAPRMGKLLGEVDLIPDEIISSTAKRAKMTVEGLLEACPFEGDVVYTRNLYHADVEEQIEVLQSLKDEVGIALLVGHNPGMEIFLEIICDESEHMPTAAIAYIQFDVGRWFEITTDTYGTLKHLWRPKELD